MVGADPVIKYIGSKRVLVPAIVAAVSAFDPVRTVLDLFSGTARVGHALKRAGKRVVANDHLAYAATLARCYVEADAEKVRRPAERLLRELGALPPRPGYVTETFCERSRYFQPKNGARIDAIREAIAERGLPPDLEAVALTSLLEAADRVDSTTGLQMAYLKSWAPRSYNDLELRLPDVLPGEGRSLQLDALAAAREVNADLVYLDPPYNQHSYMGNYHVWETIVRWDRPPTYGVACKRVQCRDYASDFNSKRRIHDALARLVEACRADHLVVSFNNEGHVSRAEMEALLARRGHLAVVEVDFKRYVGAQIGIYNPSGEKVGKVSHLRNKEQLFLVSPDRAALERARTAALAARYPQAELEGLRRRPDP
jgi:adenine-specific DNA-methyltransferase